MAKDYYWEDCMTTEGTCARFHLLWQRTTDKVESDEEDCCPICIGAQITAHWTQTLLENVISSCAHWAQMRKLTPSCISHGAKMYIACKSDQGTFVSA